MDENFVSGIPVGEASDAHQRWDLPNSNIDRGTCHVCRDGGQRNEVDNPATTNESNETNDGACDDSKRRGDDMARIFRMRFMDLINHSPGNR